jgi:hypothetical protein
MSIRFGLKTGCDTRQAGKSYDPQNLASLSTLQE